MKRRKNNDVESLAKVWLALNEKIANYGSVDAGDVLSKSERELYESLTKKLTRISSK